VCSHSGVDFDWIFFDCFNTLIDDFDNSGNESGLCSLPALAVEIGLFESERDFLAAYFNIRVASLEDGREVLLADRLTETLRKSSALGSQDIAPIVTMMMERWSKEYPAILRPTPRVHEMLMHWRDRKRLGVVSNFYAPGLPAQYLESFGLRGHFDFILDSAAFGFKKPDSRIFHQALALAGLSPSDGGNVLFIGDRLELDVYPARAVGMQTLHFNRSRMRQSIEPSPTDVVAIYDWKEFDESELKSLLPPYTSPAPEASRPP
jgi:HAD superfamily hydrolase (TIGR01549 family)